MGDFNIGVKDKTNPIFYRFSDSCVTFSMSNLVKDCPCFTKNYKSSNNLILTKISRFD